MDPVRSDSSPSAPEAAQRLELLISVSAIFAGAVAAEPALQEVAALVVASLADACTIDLTDHGRPRRVAVAVRDGVDLMHELRDAPPNAATPPVAGPEGQRHGELQAGRDAAGRATITASICARGHSIGTISLIFTAASGGMPSAPMAAFAQLLADQLAHALGDIGLVSKFAVLDARQATIVENLAEAVIVQDAADEWIYANAAAAQLLGYQSPEQMLAQGREKVVARFEAHSEDGAPLRDDQRPGHRLLTGRSAEPILSRVVDRQTGEESWRVTKATAIRDDQGRPLFAVNILEDVTEVKRAELAERFRARVGAALSDSFEEADLFTAVAQLAAAELRCRCVVSVQAGDGGFAPVATAPNQAAAPAQADAGTAPDKPEETIEAPLWVEGAAIGRLSLSSRRGFTGTERGLIDELAARLSNAVENARLYKERSAVANTLQASLMPDPLPEIAGFELACLYSPAGTTTFVGGDFFGVVRLQASWMAFIGDVTGRGVQAAALTARAHHTLLTAATILGDGAAALAILNRSQLTRRELTLCTAATVSLNETPSGTMASVLSAGHPLPLLIRQGAVTEVGKCGPLLGAISDATWDPQTVRLQPDDMLVLYTDGVTDSVGPRDRFGLQRLTEAICGADSAENAVKCISTALEQFRAGPTRDDSAALVIRRLAGDCPTDQRLREDLLSPQDTS